jgi:hypothetical protein
MRSYVSVMCKGKISNPGFDKLRAIAKAMNFPPESWFEEADGIENAGRVEQPAGEQRIADRLNHLLEAIKNERRGEAYTNIELARMSLGDLTEAEVGGHQGRDAREPYHKPGARPRGGVRLPSFVLPSRGEGAGAARREGDKRAERPEGPRHPQQEPGSLRLGEGHDGGHNRAPR